MTDITDLKAQIQAVTKENDDIKSDFKYLVFKDTQLSDNAWKAFVSKVDTASNKIDQVTQSLEVYKQSKAPISVAAKEDPNSKISSEILTDYTNLYERIKSALMDGDKLKSDLTSNYDNVLKGIQGDDNNTPTYSFIEAIKSNSLNSKAKIIQSFEGGVDADINYYLLKAVLTNLVPDKAFTGLGNMALGEKAMATGGIVTGPTRALVGEAGAEAVVPLDKFYAKLDELIVAVRQGGNIYLNGTKVGTAMSVGAYKTQ